MSTRCQIIVEGSDAVVYRHSDGYPDGACGVVKTLKPIVENFIRWRGFDECYLPAHIVADMIAVHKKDMDKTIRKMKKAGTPAANLSAYESAKYLGYGVEAYKADDENALHGDLEFLYVVKKNGTIEVRSCFTDNDGPCNIGNTKLVKTVKYKAK